MEGERNGMSFKFVSDACNLKYNKSYISYCYFFQKCFSESDIVELTIVKHNWTLIFNDIKKNLFLRNTCLLNTFPGNIKK